MANYEIKGGYKLKGSISTRFAKNAALPALYSSLMVKGVSSFTNVPRIQEVFRTIEVLKSMGVKIGWKGDHDLELNTTGKIDISSLNRESAEKTRAVIYMIGTMIHSQKNFDIPYMGGCKLGRRTIAAHLFGLEPLGVGVETLNRKYRITRKNSLKGQEIVMYESGDTATVQLLFAACMATGKTKIRMASANYMVQYACNLLNKMGAKITGIGTTDIEITGVKKLKPARKYPIMHDPIESMFFISLAATTNSSITIKQCPYDFIMLELLKLKEMGFNYQILKRYKSTCGGFDLVDIKTLPSKLKAAPDKLYGRPYPGLNIDNLPFFVPIATQAKGQTLIHDWVYENRAIYYMDFNNLGANIILADPHRVYINGPTKLKPAEVICSPVLRTATSMVIGMLAAKGTSILRNTYQINRGYEDLFERLKKLGAKIRMVD